MTLRLANPDSVALARCALLQGSPPGTTADLLARGARCRAVRPREIVFEQGSAGESLFLILPQAVGAPRPGIVALRVRDSETSASIAADFAREGDLFGEIEPLRRLADGKPQMRAFEARAISHVRVVELPWGLVQGLMRNPMLQTRLAGRLAERAAALAVALHEVGTQSLETRLARLLLALLPLLGPRQTGRRSDQATTQADLAEALGARREAVSLKLAQWRRSGVLDFAPGRHIAVLDTIRLERMAAGPSGAQSDERTVRAALDAGRALRARNLVLDALPNGRIALGLQHLAVLACARANAAEDAVLLLRRFGFAHGGDLPSLANRLALATRETLFEDIAALEPRLAKDAALAMPSGEARSAAVGAAGRAYAQVFAVTAGPYTGINAATLYAMSGDPQQARMLARNTLLRLPAASRSYYDHATRAEAELLLEQPAAAVASLRRAACATDAAPGVRSTTRRQLRQLAHAVGADWAPLDAALPQHPVVVFIGATWRGAEVSQVREAEESIQAVVAELGAGSAFGSLSAGGELLFAQALLDNGVLLNVVLPESAGPFADAVVRPADRATKGREPSWSARFDACLRSAGSIVITSHTPDAESVRQAGRHAMGVALHEADLTEAPCHLITFGGGSAIADAVAAWRALGLPLTQLSPSWPKAATIVDPAEPWRPVVFVSPEVSVTTDRSVPMPPTTLFTQARRRVAAFVADDLPNALALAESLLRSKPDLRIVLDFGHVGLEAGAPLTRDLHALRGADLLAEAPAGVICATVTFAAEARLTLPDRLVFTPAGRANDVALLPSVPLYRLHAVPLIRGPVHHHLPPR